MHSSGSRVFFICCKGVNFLLHKIYQRNFISVRFSWGINLYSKIKTFSRVIKRPVV